MMSLYEMRRWPGLLLYYNGKSSHLFFFLGFSCLNVESTGGSPAP